MLERCKSLGSLKSFLWYTPYISRASILCFNILSFLRAHQREWLQSDVCLKAGILSFLSYSRLTSSPLVVVITDDMTSFVYWYGRKIPFLNGKLKSILNFYLLESHWIDYPVATKNYGLGKWWQHSFKLKSEKQ